MLVENRRLRGGENPGHDQARDPHRQFMGNKQGKYRVDFHGGVQVRWMVFIENIQSRSSNKEKQTTEECHPG